MKFAQSCTISADRQSVWDFLMDIEQVAGCLRGVHDLTRIDDDHYEGTLRVKVGPVSLSFEGTVHIETRDSAQWRGVVRAAAKDRRVGGGVNAQMDMSLEATAPQETELHVTLDAHILGKIGEFGQPVIRKKTETMLKDFATAVNRRLA